MRIAFGSSIFVFAALVGCSSTQKVDDTPVRKLPVGIALETIQTEDYGGQQPQIVMDGALAKHVDAIVKKQHPQLEHNANLDAVAAIVGATLVEEKAFPAKTLRQWYAWQAGVSVPLQHLYGDYGNRMNDDKLDAQLRTRLAELPVKRDEGERRRYGVARIRTGGIIAQVLVVTSQRCFIDPFPKRLTAGQKQTITGECYGVVDLPDLVIGLSPTKTKKIDVEIDDDGKFSVTFEVPKTPGIHFIEMTGLVTEKKAKDDRRWTHSLLMLPIYVDTPLPSAPENVISSPAPNPVDVVDWPAEFLQQLNAARAKAGVQLLKQDKRMSGLARELVATDTPSQTGRSVDLHSVFLKQGRPIRNGHSIAGSTQFIDEEVWQMLQSPSMRRSLMSPEMSLTGLAFTQTPKDSRYRRHRILLAAPVGKLNIDSERARFMRSVKRWRKRKGLDPVVLDAMLIGIMQAHAERICSGETEPEDLTRIQKDVGKLKRRYKSLNVRTWRGNYLRPNSPSLIKDLAERAANDVGVGICQFSVGKKGTELMVYLAAEK